MKKVLQINITANTGSTGKIAEEIGLEAIEQGWESHIAYGRMSNTSKSTLYKVGNKFDQVIHLLGTRILDGHGLYSRQATKLLCKYIKAHQFDVIHLHNIHGYYLNYKIFFDYLREYGTQVIWTLHDCWAFTGHCAHFEHIGCEKWKSECFSCPLKNTYPASYGLDMSKRNYQLKRRNFNSIGNLNIISVSEWLGGLVKRSFLSSCNHDVIYNGINTEIFKPRKGVEVLKKYGINKPYVLGVSNIWTKRKGLNDFIKVHELLDPKIKIVLVGLSQKQINSLPKGILGIPRTEDQYELAILNSNAEVFVNLSILETFGLVTAEALSCGTPAIVYDTTASPELINQETGIIIKNGDIADIVTKIEKLISGDIKLDNDKCRQMALTKFNSTIQNKKYLELYNKVTENSFY